MSKPTASNFVQDINDAIWAFVNQPENKRLLGGTGSYCTPFRGEVFGTNVATQVHAILNDRPIDVLWLGSNPNAPSSLEAIVGTPGTPENPANNERFLQQKDSGSFSELAFGKRKTPWNPIQGKPRGGWAFYAKIFTEANLDEIAMANYLPWGSKSFNQFLKRLEEVDRNLLHRTLRFSDDLITGIIQTMRPQLIVVPFSLGRNKNFDQRFSSKISRNQCSDVWRSSIKGQTRKFNFSTAKQTFGSVTTNMLFIPHPASIRLTGQDRSIITEGLVSVLQRMKDLPKN